MGKKPRTRFYAVLFSVFLIVVLLASSVPAFASSPTADDNSGRSSTQIMLQYATFDPLAGEPNGPQSLSISPSSGSDLFIVQFNGPIEEGWQAQLEATGIKILEYIPQNALLVRPE